MFSGLRQNSVFYVLDKGGESPVLKTAQVVSVSNPMPKIGSYQYGETFVDVAVKCGDEAMSFNQLPSALSIANFGTNMVVADNREAMLQEVEGMRRTSNDIVASCDYHQRVVAACEDMMAVLDPSTAEKRQAEERIGGLESKMSGIETTLSNIQDMLSSALSKSPIKK